MKLQPTLDRTAHRQPNVRRSAAYAGLLFLSLLLLVVPAEAKKKKKKGEPESGVLNGRVLDMEANELVEVAVTVTSADGTTFEESASSDRKGMFTIEVAKPEGEYTVYLAKDGFAPLNVSIPLVAGEQANIDFKLISAEEGKKQQAIEEFNAGVKAFNGMDKGLAKQHFLKASQLDSNLSQALFGLADIYLDEKNYADAAEAIERFMAMQPDEIKGKRIAYEAYLGLGEDAKLRVLRAQLQGSEFAESMAIQTFNRGAIASQKNSLEEAAEQFQAALELDPKLTQAHAGLAAVYYNQEAYDKALEAIDDLLERDASNLQGHRLRYLIHDLRNDAEHLSASFDAYAAVDAPGAADALYQRADLDFRNGDLEAARKNLGKVIEVAPEMARAYYTLGLVYFSIDPAKAKEYLRKFIAMDPDDPEVATAQEMLNM